MEIGDHCVKPGRMYSDFRNPMEAYMSVQNNNGPLSVEVVVKNKHGMHLRCCNEVVRLASGFTSKLTVSNERRVADAHSMLSLATLAAVYGSRVTLTAEGDDAAEALAALEAYFNQEASE